jgi:hypothetical protein
MKVEIQSVSVEQSGKGWSKANVKFRNVEKNVSGTKTIVSFGDGAEVYKTIVQAQTGAVFDIEVKKNGEYWEWVKATPSEAPVASKAGFTPSASPRGFETPEERAQRQVYIIRQSSLANAISYFELTKNTKASVTDVLYVAGQFENHVLGIEKGPTTAQPAANPFHDMEDDIPL